MRHHVAAQSRHDLRQLTTRLLALSVLARTMVVEPDALDATVKRIAPQCDIDTQGLLRASRRVHEQFEEALAHGR